ncbi:tol-pal system protein YbgF [Rhodovulum euryhalinum]|uniref:Cell division coordinator CpoB n=1 Tax=Rhodovulum euryhalinum TaxID=35805 RepID=A0A4R2KHB1_9RHOB|nr:tol-pal system protein YbgF [Rhodovulum euryhalinum]TCO72983.1 tol-pal system protein YbgF [Rhodovulum euryhalinum]
MRIAAVLLTVSLALAVPPPAAAQARDETLADIRQEMSVLYVEIQRLKRELSTTGAPGATIAGGSALERIDAIEQELQRLTSKTEELEFRIQKIVEDGTRRIGDLEFRLVELEGGDVSQLGETTTLGGAGMATPAPALISPAPDTQGGAQLAVGEKADFDAAKAALDAGDGAAAADRFAAFTETYPGSPLSGEAHFLRGEALSAEGDTSTAARAYLDSFSGSPDGPRAAEALFKLGLALDALGQRREACVTLGEVGTRFPGSAEAQDADAAMDSIGCN